MSPTSSEPKTTQEADLRRMERMLRAAWNEVAKLRHALGVNPDFSVVPNDIAREALSHEQV